MSGLLGSFSLAVEGRRGDAVKRMGAHLGGTIAKADALEKGRFAQGRAGATAPDCLSGWPEVMRPARPLFSL
jgi:hypothetical protein